MNTFDKELQDQIENGQRVTGEDAAAYERVFRGLSKADKRLNFSPSLIDSIVDKVRYKQIRDARRDAVWFGFGLVFIVTGFLVAIVVAGITFDLGFLKNMSAYAGLLIFAVVFIGLLQWIDRRVLRSPSSEHDI